LTTAGVTFFTTGAKERRTWFGPCGGTLGAVSANAAPHMSVKAKTSANLINLNLQSLPRAVDIGAPAHTAKHCGAAGETRPDHLTGGRELHRATFQTGKELPTSDQRAFSVLLALSTGFAGLIRDVAPSLVSLIGPRTVGWLFLAPRRAPRGDGEYAIAARAGASIAVSGANQNHIGACESAANAATGLVGLQRGREAENS
jgi:hypothetical protein